MNVRRIKSLLGFAPPRSSFEALAALLPRGEFERILLATGDKREIFKVAGSALNIGESELMKRIAARLEVPYIDAPVPFETQNIAGCNAGDLRRLGAVLVTCGDGSLGIACVDPVSCEKLPERIKRLPCFISTWEQIASAHDAPSVQRRGRTTGEDVVEGVLGMLIAESEAFGAMGLEINCGETQPLYRFRTRDGKVGRGALNDGILDVLRAYLHAAAQCGEPRIIAGPNGATMRVSIGAGSSAASFEIARRESASPVSLSKPVIVPVQLETRPNSPVPAEPRSNPKVLIIDDNDTFARVLERFLARLGVVVRHYTDGPAAIDEIETIDPDLVICDVHMPALGGAEVIQRLRSNPNMDLLPAIILTSDTETETEVRLLTAGADVFLTKGEDPRILCAHVERLLSSRLQLRRAA